MRKSLLFLSFILVGALACLSQTKLGLKFSPLFSSHKISLKSDQLEVFQGKTATRMSIGLIVDHPFTDTYFLSSGLIYLPKRVSINLEEEDGGTAPTNPFESYDLNYLQIPLSLKLFTNEIAPDISLFFQVGLILEFKIFDQALNEDYEFISKFNFFDTAAIIGTGIEYRLGINTIFFTGISLQKGLINIINRTNPEYPLVIRNKIVSIDVGMKF
ncbi:MAG: outer membrane beta-barrel protein [Cyclobacteriaceae bacterium]|jgi:hypothetical protein|nr:hypothetical protein [Flammeovirgaceae bacterium]MDG1106313.1 outer membrane beta-barrel protein [Cyclobacteriaceae bacterium]|tara:strand:+ start:113 stop:757 length:645 start_codon:yes stop_codon:yes gene_type:complete